MAPNRYHCSSSQALELTLKTLRTTALVALTRTTTRVSQMTAWPTRVLIASMALDKDRKKFMGTTWGKVESNHACKRVCVRYAQPEEYKRVCQTETEGFYTIRGVLPVGICPSLVCRRPYPHVLEEVFTSGRDR